MFPLAESALNWAADTYTEPQVTVRNPEKKKKDHL